MIDAMVLRGFSPRTQESYADAIHGMAKHYRRDPARYTAQEVEAAK
jgi:integrase/recombinase XerD